MHTLKQGLLLSVLLVMGCKESKNEASKKVVQGDILSETTSIIQNANDHMNQVDKLKNMTPMSKEEYHSWLPQSILGLPLSMSSANDHTEIPEQGIMAVYKSGTKDMELRITDFAGEQASLLMVFDNSIGKERHNREEKTHYKKAVEKQGYVANELYDFGGTRKYTFLRFIHDDRYLVSVKANGFSPDELWDGLNEFNLNNLK